MPSAEARRRLRLFCDAYDLEDRASHVEMVARRQQALHDTISRVRRPRHPAFVAMWGTAHSEQPLRDRDHVLARRGDLERALA
ncbi:MAG: hypothetical protein ACXVW5_31815 [Solirubrobacteraceae bacterium]